MYEKFFGLDELPFDGLPDNRFYFVGNCQHQALELLTSNLSRNGSICILSGPSGSGKTTLVRMLIRSLPKRMRIIAIDDPRLDPHMLLATILRASGVVATSFESIAELTLKLRKLLERSVQSGIVTTVICDEAQGLSDEVIEQIRLISNIEGELGKMINFLLVGQEDLIENIQKPMHKMFWGRVKAFATIRALKRDEVHSYVNFRMQMAGCHDPVFTTRAINILYKGTKGLPRIINSVADRALCIAFNAQKKHVSGHTIKKAIEVVRHDRSLFVVGVKTFFKEVSLAIFAKIPLLVLGALISALVFSAAYVYLPHKLDSQSLQALVNKDATVQDNYNKALNAMLPGRTAKNREVALFNASVKESLFKSDAIDTLVKVWGYRRQDGAKSTCNDFDGLNLTCRTVQKDLNFVKTVDRPVVLSLRNDDLVPFYAVLIGLNKLEASLIMGNKLWKVKRSYLNHVYDGEFTYIIQKLKKGDKFEDKVTAKNYVNALNSIGSFTEYKVPEIKNKKDLKESFENYLKQSDDEDLDAIIVDKALGKGPKLEKQ